MRCDRADRSVIDRSRDVATGGNGKVSRSDGISGVARNAGRYSASREHRGCEVEHKPETKTLRRIRSFYPSVLFVLEFSFKTVKVCEIITPYNYRLLVFSHQNWLGD